MHELQTQEDIPLATPTDEDKQWMKKLPGLLRGFGAMAVLLSLYTFLARGWEGSGDLVRYLMLLGHTGLLTAIALGSAHFLKEGKSPRVLMMLSLVSTVVNFAVLGAFIFSASSGISVANYPDYVAWTVGGMTQALGLTGIAMIVLIPVVFFGFRSLARGMSTSMTTLFLFSNLALLIPLRDPVMVAIITLCLGVYILFTTAKTARQRTEVKTFEGMVVLLLQYLPIAVLLGRNIWLYSPEISLFAALCVMLFIALRQCSLLMGKDSFFRTVFELSSIVLAIGTGLYTQGALLDASADKSLALVIATIMASGMCYEISLRASHSISFYRLIAICIACTGMIANLMFYSGVMASTLTLGLGIGAIVIAYILQQRSLFIGGAILVLAGLIEQSLHFFQVFDFGYWATLAITGVVAIVLASLLESKGNAIKQKIARLKHSYSDWSY